MSPRIDLLQTRLEQCNSVKAKRLFFYLAELCSMSWVPDLDMNKIEMGKGDRSLCIDGKYIPKYGITVPKR